MRITTMMSANGFLKSLYKNNKSSYELGLQLSKNSKILRVSDDPIGVTRSIKARKDISYKEQYQKNIDDCKTYLTQTETALMSMDSIYQDLVELSKSASTDLFSESERKAVADKVESLRDDFLQIANTTYSGKYLFGGYNTQGKPFTVDASGKILYNGIDMSTASYSDAAIKKEKEQHIGFEIEQDCVFDISYNGIELMGLGDDNLYNVMTDYVNKLRSDDYEVDVSMEYNQKFKDGLNQVLNLATGCGGKSARLELVSSRYSDDLLNLEELRSNIEDIDQAETITQWRIAQSAYEASLSVCAKLIQPSLLDFLR